MQKSILIISFVTTILILSFITWQTLYAPESLPEDSTPPAGEGPTIPSHTEAELTGFSFMQDVIAAAPPASDPAAAARLYAALSTNARTTVDEATIVADIARFVGIQDVPDQGVSVEDLQVIDEETVVLILGLNYSGDRAIRALTLVAEEGAWKVDEVEALSTYPPEATDPNPGEVGSDDTGAPITRGDCYVGGCSSQVCSADPEVVTTCEWREEYACYQNATCERQTDGQCGWTETEALRACLVAAAPVQ